MWPQDLLLGPAVVALFLLSLSQLSGHGLRLSLTQPVSDGLPLFPPLTVRVCADIASMGCVSLNQTLVWMSLGKHLVDV